MKHVLFLLGVLLASTTLAQTNGWKQLPGPWYGGIRQIQISKNGIIYVATPDNRFLRYKDNVWSSFTLPPAVGQYAIMSVDPLENLFIFLPSGYSGHETVGIYRSFDLGDSWNKVTGLSKTEKLYYSASGNYYAYTVGPTSITTIFQSPDRGLSWDSITSIPLVAYDFTVDDKDQCYFSLHDHKFTVVRYNAKTNLYKAIFGQSTYSDYYATLAFCGGKVCVRANNEEYIIEADTLIKKGDLSAFRPYNYFNFSQYTSSYTNTIYTFAATDTTEEHNKDYRLFASSNFGKTWQQINEPTDIWGYSSILAFDSSGGLYLGAIDKTQAGIVGIFKSTNNGNSWEIIGPISPYYYIQESPNQGLVANSSFLSINKGSIWKKLQLGLPYESYKYQFAKFDNGTDCLIASDQGFFIDSEGIFIKQSTFNGDGPLFTNPITHGLFAFFNGSLYITTDRGITWDGIVMPATASSRGTAAGDSFGSIYLGYSPGLYKSDNDGKTWSKLITPLKNTQITSIKILDQNTIFLGTSSEGIWHSNDKALSWQRWNKSPFDNIISIETVGNMCFAATTKGMISCPLNSDIWSNELFADEQIPILQMLKHSNGHIYATATNLGIWMKDTTFSDAKSYPNRQKSLTAINFITTKVSSFLNFSLDRFTRATLTLYNILGHKIATLADGNFESGEHRVAIPSSLPEGMYCVVLTTSTEAVSTKVLIHH